MVAPKGLRHHGAEYRSRSWVLRWWPLTRLRRPSRSPLSHARHRRAVAISRRPSLRPENDLFGEQANLLGGAHRSAAGFETSIEGQPEVVT